MDAELFQKNVGCLPESRFIFYSIPGISLLINVARVLFSEFHGLLTWCPVSLRC